MARRPTLSQARQIEALLKAQTPLIRAAFEAAIANAHRSLDFTGLVAAIDQNDLGRVFDLLRINQAALFPLDEAIRVAFIAGGTSVIAPRGIVGGFGFNGRHPIAERIIAETGARLVSEIGSPGPEVIRTILLRGQVQGTGADRIARQLAGTINRITGIREGGILGLDGPRALRAESVRAILSDPARIAEYFKADGTPRYTSTGRNFDAMVRRAIKEGRALPSADLERVARAHEARLLKARGNAIAQNEAFTAQARGRNEAYRQMLDNPDVEAITKRWQHASLQHPRLDHMRLDQVTVNFDDAFPPMDDGAVLQYPHDPDGGHQHSIACFAPWTKIGRLGLKNVIKHEYAGKLVELSFGGDVPLAVTPNHPILTRRGWVAAGEITEGETLFECTVLNAKISTTNTDVKDVFATAQEIYDATKSMSGAGRMIGAVVNFHGHIPDSDVNVVSLESSLGFALNPISQKEIDNGIFAFADIAGGLLIADRLENAGCVKGPAMSKGFMRRLGAFLLGFSRGESSGSPVSIGYIRAINTKFKEASAYGRSACANLFGNWKNGISCGVEPFDLGVIGLSHRQCLGPMGDSFAIASLPVRDRDFEVLEARGSDIHAQASRAANLGKAVCSLASIPHRLMKLRPTVKVNVRLVSCVRHFHYVGPVYNFESTSNVLVSDGIVNHNCRCTVVYQPKFRKD